MRAVQHIDELQTLDGTDFVNATYITLLGRAPDPDGLRNYMAHLQAGKDKASIIAAIARSDEARASRITVPGLAELLSEQEARVPWFASFTRRDRRVANQLNRLERGLGRIARQISALEETLRALENRPDTSGSPITVTPGSDSSLSPVAGLSGLERQLFHDLSLAVEQANRGTKK